ncbi:procathepsin L-like [Macrotis lagotis]|uniref:procathepsin L-like n=1 Tax=Macrotis lagotis TaxID=92651 RepID=UPI003D68ACD1
MKKIELHNLEYSMGMHTYMMDMNQFGDMTNDEFSEKILGYKSPEKSSGTVTCMNPNLGNVPKAVDWREHGYVTPVKDQGPRGSCWAFSATGALEGQYFRKTGKLISMSEQNLMDCSWTYDNFGCFGGWPSNAFQYVKDNKGIDSEDFYPYTAENDECQYEKEITDLSVTGIVTIPARNEKALQKAVASVGPISVAIRADLYSFCFYSSGIYYDELCSESLNHAVLAVGYGFDEALEENNKYWIVKNSWGESWGNKGYIYMAKDCNNHCGIASEAAYPQM